MKKLNRIRLWVLLLTIIVLFCFVPKGEKEKELIDNKYKAVLTIWQIDTFEGGVGSRSNFLRNTSTSFSKKYKGILSVVITHSVESAKKALSEGVVPDIVSIGACGLDFSSYQKSLNNLSVEGGGIDGNKRYFVPWAKGGYFKITKNQGDDENLIISEGNYNSSLVALACSGKKVKNYVVLKSDDAINKFLIAKNATLIGTQRDFIRLKNRKVEINCEVLGDFNDLYQYVLITSNNQNNLYYSRLFVDYLLSDEIQDKLVNVSLLSTTKKGLYNDCEELKNLENQIVKYTVSPFSDLLTIEEIRKVAKEVLDGSNKTNSLINLLKQL